MSEAVAAFGVASGMLNEPEKPAFEFYLKDGSLYQIFADGRVIGKDVGVVINRIPQLIAEARTEGWNDGKLRQQDMNGGK